MNGLEEFYSDFAPPPDFLNEQVKLHSSRESLKTVKQIVNLAEANIPFEIKNDWIKEEPKLDILCAHFNFGKNELEGADYPLFLSKILPNSNIYMSYDKSPRAKALYFKAEGNTLERVPPKKSYDIIIGRAGVFNYIKPNSRFKVQIKPMGWSDRRFHIGDLVFEDDYLGCPPSPIFRNNAKYVLDNFKKEKIIIFIGAINREKNQVGFIKMVDPELCKDYVFLFLGSGTRRMARKL
jgi:glycosyltransferase involved in cell wall biosynthesis